MTLSSPLRPALLGTMVVSTIGCDQATKHIARAHLEGPPFDALGGIVRLGLTHNDGGFLSLGAALPDHLRTLVFQLAVATALLLFALYLLFGPRLAPWTQFCAWLIWAGGISNLVDRIAFDGRVTDFVVIGIGPVRTGVFNVADVAIMAGGLVLLGSILLAEEKPRGDGDPAGS